VLGWGAQAEILGPDAVRARVASVAAEIAKKYK
jgi:predicted DNA-binding transcriptional regulator YafY